MKLNNKGFALTSIIYMLIVLFLMILLLILANLAQRKVVLDKIKNDVKTNLNQGGLLAKNTYTVTFDPTIGQINQTSKQVTYNEPYGELPTPTREGYKFVGWTSKNLAPEINDGNYTVKNYRTTSEFKSENGENYIRINGNPSTTYIDTLWILYSKNIKNLNQGEYTLSFDVRSENAKERQYIRKRTGNTDGKTGIYINSANINNIISNIENDYIFDNDGQWHHFTSKITIPYYTENALIVIGNDLPNLYGTGSYIDVKNIQLEPGDTATSYEPYQAYTSDTIVTKQENHTLYAMWEPYYTVTFDANGGTLSVNTKQVLYNEPYGELPTPTREGYTFMGWNGKNLFENTNTITGYYIDSSGQQQPQPQSWPWSYSNYIEIKQNTNYSFSVDTTAGADAKHCFYDENQNFISCINSGSQTFTTPANAKYAKFSFRSTTTEIMLNEGDTATPYEPYYITSTTTVVQRNDHTLKAIWEPNE